jgi:hypothetical protein
MCPCPPSPAAAILMPARRLGFIRYGEDASARARRALSTASAGGGVIQPISGLFVGPTRDGEARGGRNTLAGTNDDMLARA